ncbi:lon protease homolog 2, peroxisomal-like [Tasmannia lanceolata]|uniref:lon protease homolog 2, peroxisomal-like n=1 Tax=Tasmannia lanceolata TaxID=3420 RepID=UPI00406358D7
MDFKLLRKWCRVSPTTAVECESSKTSADEELLPKSAINTYDSYQMAEPWTVVGDVGEDFNYSGGVGTFKKPVIVVGDVGEDFNYSGGVVTFKKPLTVVGEDFNYAGGVPLTVVGDVGEDFNYSGGVVTFKKRDTRESGVKVAEEEDALLSSKDVHRMAKPLPLAARRANGADNEMEIDSYGTCSNLHPGKSIGLTFLSSGGGLVIHVDTLKFGGKGVLQRTGLLGPVMSESIAVALSWVRSNAAALNLLAATKFDLLEDRDIHVHVRPSDLTKDGPSVGMAFATAFVSLFSNRGVRPNTAMTGEISLNGEILAVGCIKEKIEAAHAYGIKRVILPQSNLKDSYAVPSHIRRGMEILPVAKMEDVLKHAFEGGFASTSAPSAFN